MLAISDSQIVLGKALRLALIILAAYLTKRLLVRALNKLLNDYLAKIDHTLGKKVRKERIKTLSSVLSNLSSFTVWGIASLVLLSELGINIAPLIAGAGILGLGVGFASQTLVKDYISGFFLLFENQFNVGDSIEVGGKKGAVKEVSLRTTTLEDPEGNIHIIPNSQISTVTRLKAIGN